MEHPITSFSIKSNLKGIIRNLTTSYTPQLAGKELKELSTILKHNSELITTTFNLLIAQLKVYHAQIRFLAFNVMEHLFARSRIFRDLLVANLKIIIQLTTGIQSNASLPDPRIFAEKLRAKSLNLLEKWKKNYGMYYPRLRVAFKYIHVHRSRHNNIQILSNVHQIQQDYHDRNRKALIEKEVEKITYEMSEVFCNIDEILNECSTCFELLIPKLDELNFKNTSENSCTEMAIQNNNSHVEYLCKENNGSTNINESFGIIPTSSNSNTQILLSTDKESHYRYFSNYFQMKSDCKIPNCSKSNANLIQLTNSCIDEKEDSYPFICDDDTSHARDFSDSDVSDSDGVSWEDVSPYLPVVNEYSEHLYKDFKLEIDLSKQRIQITFSSDNECIIEKLQNCLKTLIFRLSPMISKWVRTIGNSENSNLLSNVIPYKTKLDNLFAKVKLFEIINPDLNQKYSLLDNLLVQSIDKFSKASLSPELNDEPLDPTSFQAQSHINPYLTSNFDNRCSDRKNSQINNFYSEDLSQWWKDEKITELPRFDGYHCYWVGEPENDLPSDVAMGMFKNRTFTYSEDYEPVLHTCDAEIGDGNFCKRKDRIKCPFHGYIVPRNTSEKTKDNSCGNFVKEYPLHNQNPNVDKLKKIIVKIDHKKRCKKYLANTKTQILHHYQLRISKRQKLEKILLNKRQLIKASELWNSQIQKRNEANFVNNFNYSLKA